MNFNPLDLLTSLFKTGYNIYQDQRDYKYQKDLQKELFARDDNALQRRMLDAEKAGINPLFALGSGDAGVTSAGTMTSKSLSMDTNFFSNQQLKRQESQAMRQEEKKREIEMKQMEINLRAGKIANWQAMQDLNTKRLEQDILKKQLSAMDEQGYYPLSTIGKTIQDVASIFQNNNPFNFPVLQPFPSFTSFLLEATGNKDYIKNGRPDVINLIKDKAQNVADTLGKTIYKKVPVPDRRMSEYEARILRGSSDVSRGRSTATHKNNKSKKYRNKF